MDIDRQTPRPSGAVQHRSPAPAVRQSSGAPTTLSHARVVELQHQAGNAAVTALLTAEAVNQHGQVAVQRYEAGEHAQFGAKPGEKEKIIRISGVRVPYGSLIALGDFYENFDQILRAPAEELQQLVDLIDRDKKARLGVPGFSPVDNDEWQKATEGRKHKFWRPPLYLDLAGKNDTHFAVANRKEWLKYHLEAIHLSQKGDLPRALGTNAFGDHFLTDAFSAGHLIPKEKTVKEAKAKIATTDPEVFARKVATSLLAHPRARAVLSQYQISPAPWSTEWKDVDEHSLADVVEFIRNWKDDKYYSMFVRAVHDKLNRDIQYGTGGIWVTNGYGSRWRLSGDETLALSTATLKIAQEAVAQSRQNVEESFQKEKVDYDELVARVWKFTPTPVDEGAALVASAEKTLTDPRNPETPPAVAQIAVDNLQMLIDELRANSMCRPKPGVLAPEERGDFEVPGLVHRPA